ncbi:MAG: BatD family protein [Myxococcota bacterium]
MVSRRQLLAGLGAVAWSGKAWAAEPARLTLDLDRIAVRQSVGATVTLFSGEASSIPVFTPSEGLSVAYSGSSQSIRIVNGVSNREVKYRFTVTAKKEGRWPLGPVRIAWKAPNGATKQLTLPVVEVTVGPPAQPAEGVDKVALTAEFLPEEAWEGQMVLYHLGLETRLQLASSQWYGHPNTGVAVPTYGQAERREARVDDPAGAYEVRDVWQPLIAEKVGTYTYDPVAVELQVLTKANAGRRSLFDLFPSTRSVTVASRPIPLTIKPLPEPPRNFSGVVGDLKVTSRVDRRTAPVGASVTWTLKLRGDADLTRYDGPVLEETEGVRIYPGEAQQGAGVKQQVYRATKTFTVQLVPTREGELVFPKLTLVTFSPTQGTYVEQDITPPPITVLPGENAEVQMQSFGDGDAPPEGSTQAFADKLARRGALASPRWGRLWAAGAVFASLPTLAALAWGGARAAQRRLMTRASSEDTPRGLPSLHALPQSRAERLAALDEALRIVMDHAPPGTPELAAEAETLRQRLNAARWAQAEDDPTEDLVAFINRLGGDV